MVSADTFKNTMSKLISPVSVVTAIDSTGTAHGFTASAVCSVSVEPPMVLVCVANSSESGRNILAAETFAVNLLASGHEPLARRFSSPGDRFVGIDLRPHDDFALIEDSLASLACEKSATHVQGDHTILVGIVREIYASGGVPLAYVERQFAHARALSPTHQLTPTKVAMENS